MKVTCTLLLSILFLASCGDAGRNPASESKLGGSLLAGGSFSDAEKNIAIRICYAFRSKNTNYRANFLNEDFQFLISQRNCDGSDQVETINAELKAALASGPMIYDASTSLRYYKKVQTDQVGPLKDICTHLLQGGDPQRTTLSGNNMVEVSFFNSVLDNFIIRTADKVGSSYEITKEERFTVNSDSATAGNHIGQITLATRDESCSNGRVATFSQQVVK